MVILTHFLAPDLMYSIPVGDFQFNPVLHPFVVKREQYLFCNIFICVVGSHPISTLMLPSCKMHLCLQHTNYHFATNMKDMCVN